MNVLAPVSTIMSKTLITVNPEDALTEVKKIFDQNPIHHLPVVRYTSIVGIISKTDMYFFMQGYVQDESDKFLEEARLRAFKARDIMTEHLAKVDIDDSIRTVLDVFKQNRFHALPVMEDGKLVGIVTTHDVIKALADAPISLKDYDKDKKD